MHIENNDDFVDTPIVNIWEPEELVEMRDINSSHPVGTKRGDKKGRGGCKKKGPKSNTKKQRRTTRSCSRELLVSSSSRAG